jgi:hypothetical protein
LSKFTICWFSGLPLSSIFNFTTSSTLKLIKRKPRCCKTGQRRNKAIGQLLAITNQP